MRFTWFIIIIYQCPNLQKQVDIQSTVYMITIAFSIVTALTDDSGVTVFE